MIALLLIDWGHWAKALMPSGLFLEIMESNGHISVVKTSKDDEDSGGKKKQANEAGQ